MILISIIEYGVRIFFVYLQSPEQIRNFTLLRTEINKSSKFNLFIVVDFNVRNQAHYSVKQYENSISRVRDSRTILIPASIYHLFHRLFLRIPRLPKFIEFISGNIIGSYSLEILNRWNSAPLTAVDDGIDIVDVANHYSQESLFPNLRFFSKYSEFMSNKCRQSIFIYPQSNSSTVRKSPQKTLGILGGPYVELEGLSVEKYLAYIRQVQKVLDCDQVFYFMHRRETFKFNMSDINELIDTQLSSLELIESLEFAPALYWSLGSSALIDLHLKYSTQFDYHFSKAAFPRNYSRFFIDRDINSSMNLYSLYERCGFNEILLKQE